MTAPAGLLAGKVVIVTGASRGLGRWCAEGYAAAGAVVIVAARSLAGARETVALIEAAGGHAAPLICDVGDAASVQRMAAMVVERFGRIDVLMCNAAYFAPGTISTMSDADWTMQFRVNVDGVFHSIRAVLPAMTAAGSGTIINISSVAAGKGSHYGVTKRAVDGMTLAFAEEQAANGICVTSLRPVAAIETPGWLAARDAATRQTRQHRVSPPDSYVAAAVLLAAHASIDEAGRVLTDAEVLRRFGDPADLEYFKTLNAPVWRDSLVG